MTLCSEMRLLYDCLQRLRRIDAFVERQPLWRQYAAIFVIAAVTGIATGHSFETTASNTLFVVVLFTVYNTARWLSRRRQLRQAANTPGDHPETGSVG
jgi:hypothetical protein